MEFVIERLLTKHILKKEKNSEFVVIKEQIYRTNLTC